MKKILTVIAVIAITLFSCTKQAEQQSAPETMNGIEFKTKYKFELPFLDYGYDVASYRGPRRPKAEDVALTVFDGDLVLSKVAGSLYHSTISVNAEWAAFQNLTDTVSITG